jgi:hypothetical protein
MAAAAEMTDTQTQLPTNQATPPTAAQLLALAQAARQTKDDEVKAKRAARDDVIIQARKAEATRILTKFQDAMTSGAIAQAAAQGKTTYPLDHFYPPRSTMPDGTTAPWELTHTAPEAGCPRILVVLGPKHNDEQGRPYGEPDPNLLPGERTALQLAKDMMAEQGEGFYLFTRFCPKTRPDGSPNPFFKRNTIYVTWADPDTPPKTKPKPRPQQQTRRFTPTPAPTPTTTPTTKDDADPLAALAALVTACRR